MSASEHARVTVIVSTGGKAALASIDEREPVATLVGRAIGDVQTPYEFELAGDEELVRGALARMADVLDREGDAASCAGRARTVSATELLRTVPATLDPFRLVYSNEFPAAALYRREALVDARGWRRLTSDLDAQSDWSLWIALAERGSEIVHLGSGQPSYVHYRRSGSLTEAGRARRATLVDAVRARHAGFMADAPRWRAQSPMSPLKKRVFPLVYGRRRRFAAEAKVKALLDRAGVWTESAAMPQLVRDQLDAALRVAHDLPAVANDAPVAVIVPCFNNGGGVVRAIRSLREVRPLEVVIVDDGSSDAETLDALRILERGGITVVRHPENRGVSAARATGLEQTSAPYVFPLDADDVAVPGAVGRMLDTLQGAPRAQACVADYVEITVDELPGEPGRSDPLLRRRGATGTSKSTRLDETVVTRLQRRTVR